MSVRETTHISLDMEKYVPCNTLIYPVFDSDGILTEFFWYNDEVGKNDIFKEWVDIKIDELKTSEKGMNFLARCILEWQHKKENRGK